MTFSYDGAARPLRALIAAARRQPAWFGAAAALALFYVAFLVCMKMLSGNIAETFFEQLPARAAARPAVAALPLCIDFTSPAPRQDTDVFGFGAFESWGPPGRWMVGAVAGLSVIVPPGASELSFTVKGTTLIGAGRPHVAYELSANGDVIDRGVLTKEHPQLDKTVIIPAALGVRQRTLVVALRTPDITSARAAGLSQDWRKLGISVSAMRLFRVQGPSCP